MFPPEIYKQELISQTNEGKVYLINDSIIMKEYVRNGHLLEYEYRVGCELNKINHPNLIQTYHYSQDVGRLYLEYVSGKTLSSLLPTLKNEEMKLILRHLIYIILDIQSQIKFTHYDLHGHNILVTITEPKIYNYVSGSILSPYQIKFIDYGSTHVPNVATFSHLCHLGNLEAGMIVEVFDPLYDILFLTLNFNHRNRFLSDELIETIKNLGFDITGNLEGGQGFREQIPEVKLFDAAKFIDNNVPVIRYIPDIEENKIIDNLRLIEIKSDHLYTYGTGLSYEEYYEEKKSDPTWMYGLQLYLYEYLSLVAALKSQRVKNRNSSIITEILQFL